MWERSAQERAVQVALDRGQATNSGQTYFEYGRDHFSEGHANHRGGQCTEPVQRDFGLRHPDGSFQLLEKQPSPPGLEVQPTLYDFKWKP